MSTVEQVTAVVTDHLERRWLVWVVGVAALLVGIVIGYVLPSGGSGMGASTSVTGITTGELRQGGR